MTSLLAPAPSAEGWSNFRRTKNAGSLKRFSFGGKKKSHIISQITETALGLLVRTENLLSGQAPGERDWRVLKDPSVKEKKLIALQVQSDRKELVPWAEQRTRKVTKLNGKFSLSERSDMKDGGRTAPEKDPGTFDCPAT